MREKEYEETEKWLKDNIVMGPLDMVTFRGDRLAEVLHDYHQAKSKEEAKKRYEKAMEYIILFKSKALRGAAQQAAKLAAFGKEEE